MNKELESMKVFLRAIKAVCENQRSCDGCLIRHICPEVIPVSWGNIEKLKLEVNYGMEEER